MLSSLFLLQGFGTRVLLETRFTLDRLPKGGNLIFPVEQTCASRYPNRAPLCQELHVVGCRAQEVQYWEILQTPSKERDRVLTLKTCSARLSIA